MKKQKLYALAHFVKWYACTFSLREIYLILKNVNKFLNNEKSLSSEANDDHYSEFAVMTTRYKQSVTKKCTSMRYLPMTQTRASNSVWRGERQRREPFNPTCSISSPMETSHHCPLLLSEPCHDPSL